MELIYKVYLTQDKNIYVLLHCNDAGTVVLIEQHNKTHNTVETLFTRPSAVAEP